MDKQHHQVLIIGGGTAGITIAAQLANQENPPQIAIVEPSEKHYYQPIWTLVGGGVFPKEISEKNEADFIPEGVTWIKERIKSFDPKKNTVVTNDGQIIGYDYLVVTAGIQINWGVIPGLKENLGKNGVCSNYSYDSVMSTWDNIRNFKGGNAIFTQPGTPIKCGGAPQKICYLAEHSFRKSGVRSRTNVIFAKAQPGIFAVTKYADALRKVCADRDIDVKYQHDLVEIHGDRKEAVFQDLASDKKVTIPYEMIHVTPPQGAPDFIAQSPLAGEGGWVSVDKHTMQHTEYDNVFSCGDCSSLPTSKTGAAIRKQAPVLVANLLSKIAGRALVESYDGYTSCPLVTGYGSLILAEFDYDKEPMESFPFNQAEERYSMYALKAYGLPRLYWHGMLRGRA